MPIVENIWKSANYDKAHINDFVRAKKMRNAEQNVSVKSLLAGSAVVSSTALPQTWARPVTRADAHARTKSSVQGSNDNVNTGYKRRVNTGYIPRVNTGYKPR